MVPTSYILASSTSSFEPVEGDSTLYRKEVIYPGNFVKKTPKGEVEFSLPVDEQLIDHWVATFNKMKSNGIDVPMPIEHTTDPAQRRGEVVKLAKEYNKDRKCESMYMYCRFNDPESAKQFSNSQVSLYSPPEFVDGKDNRYVRPIRHVALTDYPLIPGLGKFEIAASYVALSATDDGIEEDSMNSFAALADELGVPYEEGADDATIAQAIVDAWNAEPEVDDEESVDDEMVDETEEDPLEEDTDPLEEEEVPASISASVIKTVTSARKAQLDALLAQGKISPVQKRDLDREFCTSKQVTFALSLTDGSDGFDAAVGAFSKGAVQFSTTSRTGPQSPEESVSPMVRDAEARRAAARKS